MGVQFSLDARTRALMERSPEFRAQMEKHMQEIADQDDRRLRELGKRYGHKTLPPREDSDWMSAKRHTHVVAPSMRTILAKETKTNLWLGSKAQVSFLLVRSPKAGADWLKTLGFKPARPEAGEVAAFVKGQDLRDIASFGQRVSFYDDGSIAIHTGAGGHQHRAFIDPMEEFQPRSPTYFDYPYLVEVNYGQEMNQHVSRNVDAHVNLTTEDL
jgi:hypothetical protein